MSATGLLLRRPSSTSCSRPTVCWRELPSRIRAVLRFGREAGRVGHQPQPTHRAPSTTDSWRSELRCVPCEAMILLRRPSSRRARQYYRCAAHPMRDICPPPLFSCFCRLLLGVGAESRLREPSSDWFCLTISTHESNLRLAPPVSLTSEWLS